MVQDPLFYTETMARLLARQGKLREAAEIYRHLLAREGRRPEIRQALVALEGQMEKGRNAQQEATAEMFGRWVEMMLRLQNVRGLAGCLNMLREHRRRGAS